jgi:hypothetical protein
MPGGAFRCRSLQRKATLPRATTLSLAARVEGVRILTREVASASPETGSPFDEGFVFGIR